MASEEIRMHYMSVRNPWAYLIAKGYKRIENRHKGIALKKLNQPIALHVAKKAYSKQERHKYYQLEVVQQCLKMDDPTKSIHDNNEKLDQFFSELAGSIIAISYITKTIKAKQHKEASKYRFANIPKQDSYHWIISKTYLLPSPIANCSGCLGVMEIKDENTVELIEKYIKQLNQRDDNHDIINMKKEHLFIPESVKQNQMKLLRYNLDFDGDLIRFIYDTEDEENEEIEIDDAETESEAEDDHIANKENENPLNTNLNSFEQKFCEGLLNRVNKEIVYNDGYWVSK